MLYVASALAAVSAILACLRPSLWSLMAAAILNGAAAWFALGIFMGCRWPKRKKAPPSREGIEAPAHLWGDLGPNLLIKSSLWDAEQPEGVRVRLL
jgi:hypothetical protein